MSRLARLPAGVLRTVVTGVLAIVALVAWAFASPVGSSPDDDYHMVSIWCGQGTVSGFCETGPEPGTRKVPLQLLTAPCYAFDSTKSASCQDEFVTKPDLIVSNRGNFAGAYPPVYYWTMNWFAGRDVIQSVLVMRLFNILLAVAMVTAVVVLSPPGVRRGVIAAACLTAVPLGMFVLSSVNPSAWALTSAFTFTFALVGYLVTDRRRRWTLAGLAAFSLLLGAGARADGGLYAALGAVIAVLVAWRVRARKDLILPVVLAAIGLATFLTAGQTDDFTRDQGSIPSLFSKLGVLFDIPSLWVGAAGGTGLGWLDTRVTPAVWVVTWTVVAGVVFAALPGG
ncbi:MAG: DUF2142 domain-containing protein, partial [Micrococcales bacterium]|nr:DUF2142 domain-containing protein [Micrococcales bacterium]